MMILGVILTMLLPGIYLFYTRSQASSDQISVQRMAQMGNDVVSGTEYVYPFGAGSKTTLDFTMPAGVTNITVRGNAAPNEPGTEFVINLLVKGYNHSLVYFSKYPIFIGNCTSVKPFTNTFVTTPGKKVVEIISCGANVSIYQKN